MGMSTPANDKPEPNQHFEDVSLSGFVDVITQTVAIKGKGILNAGSDARNMKKQLKKKGVVSYEQLTNITRKLLNYIKNLGFSTKDFINNSLVDSCALLFEAVMSTGILQKIGSQLIGYICSMLGSLMSMYFGIPLAGVPVSSTNINISIVFKPVLNPITEITNIVSTNYMSDTDCLIKECTDILTKCPQVGKITSALHKYVVELKNVHVIGADLMEVLSLLRTFYAHYKKTQSHDILVPIFALNGADYILEDGDVSDWIILMQSDDKLFKSNDYVISSYNIGGNGTDEDTPMTTTVDNNGKKNAEQGTRSTYMANYLHVKIAYFHRIMAALERLFKFSSFIKSVEIMVPISDGNHVKSPVLSLSGRCSQFSQISRTDLEKDRHFLTMGRFANYWDIHGTVYHNSYSGEKNTLVERGVIDMMHRGSYRYPSTNGTWESPGIIAGDSVWPSELDNPKASNFRKGVDNNMPYLESK